MPKFSTEERKKALGNFFGKMGKGGHWYAMDKKDLESNFNVGRFEPEDSGDFFLSILPRPEDAKFFKEVFVHYNVGPNKFAFLCPKRMFGENCPVCDYAMELKDSGEPDEIWKSFMPTNRFFMWVVDMKNKRTIKSGPLLYDAPYAIMKGISGLTVDKRTGEMIDISDPDERKNVVFSRKKKRQYEAFNLEDREDKIPDDYFDLPNIDEVLIAPDIAEMRAAIFGDTAPDEKPERVKKTRQKEEEPEEEEEPRKVHRTKPVEEEEEEEPKRVRKLKPVEEEEPEEEEEKPKSRVRKVRDLDEEEEPEEEEEKVEKVRDHVKRFSRRTRE
jgi:hypothetical protein